MNAMINRTDNTPTPKLRGFDEKQNVFLYDGAKSPNQEAALFFPVDCYYPDSEEGKAMPYAQIVQTFQDYDVYLATLGDGEVPDNDAPAVKAYAEMNKRVRSTYYFETVRFLLGDLLNGVAPDQVFENRTPDPSDAENWADYKSAFFDATGLLCLVDQIDMPRMAAGGGFEKFKRDATPQQLLSIERFANPDRFDAQGNYIDNS